MSDKVTDGGACVACGGAVETVLEGVFDTRFGIDGDRAIARCSGCGLEQINPVPTGAELGELYGAHYNFGGEKGTRYTAVREALFGSRLYRLWLAIDGDISFHTRRGAGRLLDLGCNEGRGLERYRASGFDVEGLELNEPAAAVAREKGFSVECRPVEELPADAAFDVVVLSNVLEHSRDPREMLRAVRRTLKPGGEAWISCPNGRSWLRRLFGRYWINWHVPFHIVSFDEASLSRLLTEEGFTPASIRHETPALWVAQSIIARVFSRKGRRTTQLRSMPLVAALTFAARFIGFPLLWLGNRLGRGDAIVVVARAE